MDAMTRSSLGTTFNASGQNYSAQRPGYPIEAAAWLTSEDPLDLLDLAAGSGQLTVVLRSLGHRVVAVEPSPSMLDELRGAGRGAAVRSLAEQLPFASAVFDAATVATAFHWFDASRALPEIARVLRPGGRLGLVWNTREADSEWSRGLAELLFSVQPPGLEGDWGTRSVEHIWQSPLFDELEYEEFRHAQSLSRNALVGLVTTRSYVIALAPDERRRLLSEVASLYDDAAPTSSPLELTYRAQCWRTHVR
ncbi:MAG: class I SAM-dependent methyltransferase [Nocardioidaceae bacterium]